MWPAVLQLAPAGPHHIAAAPTPFAAGVWVVGVFVAVCRLLLWLMVLLLQGLLVCLLLPVCRVPAAHRASVVAADAASLLI